MKMFSETCIAPVNIAVIKYWGKRNEELILPINDSLSATLSTEQMCAKTSVAASGDFKENRMWLNGEEINMQSNKRLQKCLQEIKLIVKAKGSSRFPLDWNIHICSENNFPTAAGLASSAAGYACFVYTLACLYGIEDEELTKIARQGSGSACRSIYGGFVQWIKGELENGEDSLAKEVQPASYWPEMRILILVVNDSRKKISSTQGMQNSVLTSELLKYRSEFCVPKRISLISKAIQERNFANFGEITMKDSNQFHAVCLDTYPPFVYMNEISHSIIDFVHKYNEVRQEIKVAYTFDAGPNACLYLLENEVPNVLSAINNIFPSSKSSDDYITGIPIALSKALPLDSIYGQTPEPLGEDLIKYIIHTKIGDGPKKLNHEQSLLYENGLPKNLK